MFESLEQRRLMSTDHPLGVVLNGTALSTVNNYLPTTINQIKNLGIDSVRIYEGIPSGATSFPTSVQGDFEHLFDLYDALGPSSSYASHKFNILMTVSPQMNATPTTGTNLQNYLTGMLNYQESGGTRKLKDIISRWELGNEINTEGYYDYSSSDSSPTSTARLDHYINNFLVPAASTISSLDPTSELSAGAILAYSGNTSNTLTYLLNNTPQTTMNKLKYMSFHPYGTNATNSLTSTSSGVLALNGSARSQVDTYNSTHTSHPLSLISTEWGTNNPGTDSGWASQLNQSFTGANASQTGTVANSIRDTYDTAYYYPFAYDNDTDSTIHGGQALVTLAGSGAETPRTSFYNTFSAWSNGKITGQLTGSDTGNRKVYVDSDGVAGFSAGDVYATTASDGTYQLNYSVGSGSNPFIQGGDYAIGVAPSSGLASFATQSVHITAASTQAFNFVNGTTPPPTDTTGSITGVYWGDNNANGVKDAGESGQGGKVIYLDANANGALDTGESQTTTASDGTYSFTGLTLGQTYRVRRNGLPTGYRFTTPIGGFYNVTPTSSTATVANVDFLTTTTSTAYITGTYFGDSDEDGTFDTGETGQAGKVMYIDANNNGVLDSGEQTSTTDANGLYHFDNLAVSSTTVYHIRRSGLPAGYRLTSPSSGVIDLVLSSAKSYDDNNFGVTYA